MTKLRGPPLLTRNDMTSSGRHRTKVRMAEVAGGATAECAAVFCCIPWGVVDLLFQAIYRVPAELCRNAMRKKRRRRLTKNGSLPKRGFCDDSAMRIHHVSSSMTVAAALAASNEDAVEFEKEMWNRFYGTGFWRSPSQRSEITKL